jgi:hypothetical protein
VDVVLHRRLNIWLISKKRQANKSRVFQIDHTNIPGIKKLLRRAKLAFKPADNVVGLERIRPVALLASQRARPFVAGSQRKTHQRTALRASYGFGCLLHGKNFWALEHAASMLKINAFG